MKKSVCKVLLITMTAMLISGCSAQLRSVDAVEESIEETLDPLSEDAAVSEDAASQNGVVSINGIELLAVDKDVYEITGKDESGTEVLASASESLTVESEGYDELKASLGKLCDERKKALDTSHKEYLGVIKENGILDYQMEMLPFSNTQLIQARRYDSKCVGILYEEYTFLGGVHPNLFYYGYNFDARSGKRISLKDAVTDYDKFTERISREIKASDCAPALYDDYEDLLSEILAEADDSAMLAWCLGPDSLTVIFNTYSLGPYVIGDIWIEIPYEDGLVKDEYILTGEEAQLLYPGTGESADDSEVYDYEEPEIIETGAEEAEQDYVIEDSDTKLLSEADIEGLKQYELKRARNEIYARHGRIFANAAMARYFDLKPWYEGTIYGDNFDELSLSEIERKNIKLIQSRELELTGGKDPAKIESSALAFLSQDGANGILNRRFDNVGDALIPIYEVVYQMNDPDLSDKVGKSLDAQNIETFCDLSCIKKEDMNEIAISLTGYDLESEVWDDSSIGYDEANDAYYFDHGDTNRVTFIGELWSVDDDIIAVKCYPYFGYSEEPFIVTLRSSDDGYTFVSIQ